MRMMSGLPQPPQAAKRSLKLLCHQASLVYLLWKFSSVVLVTVEPEKAMLTSSSASCRWS